MHEIKKPVAYENLMEEVMERVTVCGGWDEKTETFKPGVSEQIKRVHIAAQRPLGLSITD